MGWRRFFRRAFWDAERARELEAHLQIETDENIARGLSPEDARHAARRQLGNVTRIREEIYFMNTAGWLEALVQDARYTFRQWRHNASFTLLAVFTLAVGIGAVAVMYSVLHNIVLEPFPYAEQQRMVDVVIREVDRPDNVFRGPFAGDEFLDYQEQSRSFEEVIGAQGDPMLYTTGQAAERVAVVKVTANTFAFLGVRALHGRALIPDDGRPGAPPVTVLAHDAWTRYFGADPGVLGRTVVLDGEARTVVGVMPPRFTWHVGDFWIPVPLERRGAAAGGTSLWFQARLKPDVSVDQAEAELQGIADRRALAHPDEYPPRFRIDVITVIDWVVGRYRRVLYTLLAAVGLLLLIACANVANMLLARATAREREMTLRAALGASRWRLLRQLLVESLLLAGAGAASGCLLAWAGIQGLVRAMPRQNVPYETEIALDGPVLAVALAAAVASALLFGLLPAWHAAKRDVLPGLRQSGKGTGSAGHGRLRNTLVVAQVALSLVLLLGAGLLMRTFVALLEVDFGFDPRGIVGVPLAFPPGEGPSVADKHRFLREAVARVAALPGVEAAAVANGTPPFGGLMSEVATAAGTAPPAERAVVRLCGEDFMRLVGFRLSRGRALSEADVVQARKVAVVNEAFVKRYLAGRDPLGEPVTLARFRTLPDPVPDPVFEIVGVVRDVTNAGVRAQPAPEVMVPTTITGPSRTGRQVLVRVAAGRVVSLEAIRREIWSVDRGVGLMAAWRLEDEAARVFYAQPRFTLIILAAFAGTGLLLVSLGVYGVLAYTVSQQTQEIAVRMALGAGRSEVLGMVLRMGLKLIGAGVAAGLLASMATNRLIMNQLWNTSPYDPLTVVAAVVVIGAAALAACYVPAARALRVDPIAALRAE